MNKTIGHVVWRQYRVHIVWFIAGIVVGVIFANWLRGIVTMLFVAGVVLALCFIWSCFDRLKKP